jgi:hypothetical protein
LRKVVASLSALDAIAEQASRLLEPAILASEMPTYFDRLTSQWRLIGITASV